jgi:hypothetical protein
MSNRNIESAMAQPLESMSSLDADVPNEELEETVKTPLIRNQYLPPNPKGSTSGGALAAAPNIIAINQDNVFQRLNGKVGNTDHNNHYTANMLSDAGEIHSVEERPSSASQH